jgi:3-oxoacyl-(acyl-carrier-protein) synthase
MILPRGRENDNAVGEYAHPTHFGFGGHNACLLMKKLL